MLCTAEVADGRQRRPRPAALMHGPTFMGNPLACSIALASLDLLEQQRRRARRSRGSQAGLRTGLEPARDLGSVARRARPRRASA